MAEWFGPSKGRDQVKAEVVELADPGAAPYESGSMLLNPRSTMIPSWPSLRRFTSSRILPFTRHVHGSTKGWRILPRPFIENGRTDARLRSTSWDYIARQ